MISLGRSPERRYRVIVRARPMRVAGPLAFVIAGAAVVAACQPSVVRSSTADEAQRATAPAELPGTYDLALCRGERCVPRDTATAYLLATLVLFDSAGAVRADLPPVRYQTRQRATGCFWIRYRKRVGDSYAGILLRDYFIWTGAGGVVRFPLYRSPDAGYGVELRRNPTGLVGGGTSWGVDAAEIHAPRDTVVATRLGPADRLRCHTTG
jgi:hypothetical protein